MSNRSSFIKDANPDWIGRRNAAGIREAVAIATSWDLGTHDLATLLGTDPQSLDPWCASAAAEQALEVDEEIVERISYLLGISVALKTLFPTPSNRGAWLRSLNTGPALNGCSPLDHMLTGGTSGLRLVRSVIDANLG